MADDAPTLPPDLTVGQLHNLLWTKSKAAVARELDCDSAWLNEFCAYAGIPLPSPDYWRRKRAGKRVNQRSLPKGLAWREQVSTLVAKRAEDQPAVAETVLEPDVVDLIAKIESLEIEVAPPDSKRRLHPTVSATRKLIRRHARDEWPSRFNRIRRREPLPEPAFIAEVGTGSTDRATQLLQAFVDAVLGLGGSLVTDRGDVVGVVLLGEPHGLRLRERLKRCREAAEPGGAVAEVWSPTGILELHLEEWPGGELLAKWSDDPSARLEGRLREVIASFVKLAQASRTRIAAVRRAAEQKQRDACHSTRGDAGGSRRSCRPPKIEAATAWRE